MPGKSKFYFTDVFGAGKYSGNQLATFVNCGALSADEMQKIAREINFSETTFITSDAPTDGAYDVRIFTPKEEVEFAGHPTLGSAHVIREKIIKRPVNSVTLNLKIGKIMVSFSDNNSGILRMHQAEPRFGKTLAAAPVAAALGLSTDDVRNDYPILEVSTGFPHIIVPLRTLDALKRIKISRDKYHDLVQDAWAKIILVFVNEPYTKDQALAVRVFADYYGIPRKTQPPAAATAAWRRTWCIRATSDPRRSISLSGRDMKWADLPNCYSTRAPTRQELKFPWVAASSISPREFGGELGFTEEAIN